MTLASLLTPERVIPSMQSTEHWSAILELADRLIDSGSYPPGHRDELLQALRQREDRRSTGIGGGIAIPHAFSDHIREVTAVFGRSPRGIEFGAPDQAPVHWAVLFLVPCQQFTLHLRALAAIARTLNHADTRTRLAEAAGPAEILSLLGGKSSAAPSRANSAASVSPLAG